jgi:opacity protein-like surface antigen
MRPWWQRPITLALVLVVALLAAPAAAQDGDDDEEEGGDGQYGGPQAIPDVVDPEFHPVYKLSHTRDKEISGWTHNFSLNYPLARRVSFNATTNITLRENDVLNRKNLQETWNTGIGVAVSSAISTEVKFNRIKQRDVRNEGKPNEVRSFREKESVDLSTSYRKVYLNGIDVSMGVTGGFEKNRYADVKSRGVAQSINATLRYEAPMGLDTNFSYTGRHSLLDSEQGALESTDESIDHNFTGRLAYGWEANRFTVDLRRSAMKKEYPKEQQTERREQNGEAIAVGTELQLLPDLTTSVSFNFNRSASSYKLEPSRDNDLKTYTLDGSISYTLGDTRFSSDLRSEKKRSDYFDVQTGDSYSQSFGATLSHRFSERLSASLRGRMSLLQRYYDDIEENDQDRDLFDQEATLSFDYSPRSDIRAGLSIKVREDQLIYIRRSRTGDNKTTQTFLIQPSIKKDFGPKVSVSQRYELSADYTLYAYDRDSNFLIRNFVISTGFDWRPLGGLGLNVDHKYRGQDEGAYREDESGVERYARNSERDDNSMSISVRYRLLDLIDLEVKQELSFQKKWTFSDEERRLAWEKYDTSVTGRASLSHSLEDGTRLSVSVARTHRDATNIVERQREVWNITANIDKTF